MIHRLLRRLVLATPVVASLAVTSLAWAGPGAHGPNGEHLDAPSGAHQAIESTPRMEAKSEDFELVARLVGAEFTLMINRFATGEPVLGAMVDVESGPRKVLVPFREDKGDYATSDAELLKLLATPGAHPLVITIVAGKDSDLLDGTLAVSAQALSDPGHRHEAEHDHDHAGGHEHEHGWQVWLHKPLAWVFGLAALAAALWGAALWRRRRWSSNNSRSGAW